jgi:hypothetical protein
MEDQPHTGGHDSQVELDEIPLEAEIPIAIDNRGGGVDEVSFNDEVFLPRPPSISAIRGSAPDFLALLKEQEVLQDAEMDLRNLEDAHIRDSSDHVIQQPSPVALSVENSRLTDEKPLGRKKLPKIPRKSRPPAVNYGNAKQVIRLSRQGTGYCGEGYYSDAFPDDLDGLLSVEEWQASINNLNSCLNSIPSLRVGLIWIVPTIVLTLVLFYVVAFWKTLPFFLLMTAFGLWCTFALATVVGFAIYYIVCSNSLFGFCVVIGSGLLIDLW